MQKKKNSDSSEIMPWGIEEFGGVLMSTLKILPRNKRQQELTG